MPCTAQITRCYNAPWPSQQHPTMLSSRASTHSCASTGTVRLHRPICALRARHPYHILNNIMPPSTLAQAYETAAVARMHSVLCILVQALAFTCAHMRCVMGCTALNTRGYNTLWHSETSSQIWLESVAIWSIHVNTHTDIHTYRHSSRFLEYMISFVTGGTLRNDDISISKGLYTFNDIVCYWSPPGLIHLWMKMLYLWKIVCNK
jgi:hypothetical protein